MTMHLMHPAFSTTGKRKGKVKFRSAEQARKARELAEEWERKQAEWAKLSKPVTKVFTTSKPKVSQAPVRETPKINSLNSWVTGAVNCAKPMQYTGDKMLGIGTMHKSNAVPVFSSDEAADLASMRR